MGKPHFLPKLAIAGVAGVAMLAAPIKAEAAYFKLDDFNVTETKIVDTEPMTPGVPPFRTDVSKTLIGGDIWPADWDRDRLETMNVDGDPGLARLCSDCGAFEMISGTGGSQNKAWVNYSGPTFDLSVYDGWMPHYSADLPNGDPSPTNLGGDLRLRTGPDANGDGLFDIVLATSESQFPNGLPNTGGAAPEFLETLMLSWEANVNLTVSNLQIEIDGTGVNNLDFTVDHKKAPEPGTILGLLAVGGLGLGLKHKKQS